MIYASNFRVAHQAVSDLHTAAQQLLMCAEDTGGTLAARQSRTARSVKPSRAPARITGMETDQPLHPFFKHDMLHMLHLGFALIPKRRARQGPKCCEGRPQGASSVVRAMS